MKKKLDLNEGKTVYEYENPSIFERDGKTYEFISFKKITAFKEQKKYQNLTIRKEDQFAVFGWLRDCIDGEIRTGPEESETPF